MRAENRNAPPLARRGVDNAQSNGHGLRSDSTAHFHVAHASAQTLLDRLDGVQKSGNGWRARCPACDGSSRKVSIAERDDRVLVNCFGGCKADDVLGAVGLAWRDLHPPRTWPPSKDERRAWSRAQREASWGAAIDVAALESRVALIAARELHLTGGIEVEDGKRLALAVQRLESAATVLGGAH